MYEVAHPLRVKFADTFSRVGAEHVFEELTHLFFITVQTGRLGCLHPIGAGEGASANRMNASTSKISELGASIKRRMSSRRSRSYPISVSRSRNGRRRSGSLQISRSSFEDELREIWSDPDSRNAFLQCLTEMGYDRERLADMRRLIEAPDSDIFDVLGYIRFTLAPLVRAERVETAKATGMDSYEEEMREFLDYVLRSYAKDGIRELDIQRRSHFI